MSENSIKGCIIEVFWLCVGIYSLAFFLAKILHFLTSNIWWILAILIVLGLGVYALFFHKKPPTPPNAGNTSDNYDG